MTLGASPTTHEIGRGHSAPGAIYEGAEGARSARALRRCRHFMRRRFQFLSRTWRSYVPSSTRGTAATTRRRWTPTSPTARPVRASAAAIAGRPREPPEARLITPCRGCRLRAAERRRQPECAYNACCAHAYELGRLALSGPPNSKRPVASRSRSYRLLSGNGGNQDSRRTIQLS
jgi:hypothetical protein